MVTFNCRVWQWKLIGFENYCLWLRSILYQLSVLFPNDEQRTIPVCVVSSFRVSSRALPFNIHFAMGTQFSLYIFAILNSIAQTFLWRDFLSLDVTILLAAVLLLFPHFSSFLVINEHFEYCYSILWMHLSFRMYAPLTLSICTIMLWIWHTFTSPYLLCINGQLIQHIPR